MTKKDYELIAKAVLGQKPLIECPYSAEQYLAWERVPRALADALQADNPRFDRERFLKACGVTEA